MSNYLNILTFKLCVVRSAYCRLMRARVSQHKSAYTTYGIFRDSDRVVYVLI